MRYLCTSDIQLRCFQVKLLHRLLQAKRYLFIRNIADSPLSTFCGQVEGSDISQIHRSELKLILHKNRANWCNFHFSKELVLFGTTTNCTIDKPRALIILVAKFYVYKCKLHGSMPELSVSQTIFRSRNNIQNYASFMLEKNFDFKMRWLFCKTVVQ